MSQHERNRDIIQRYESAETLEAIGERYGITRERVRQIVKLGGGPQADAVRQLRREQKVESLERESAELAASIREAVAAAAQAGRSRADVDSMTRALFPDKPAEVVSEAIRQTGAVFSVNVEGLAFSVEAVACAYLYVHARIRGIFSTPEEALATLLPAEVSDVSRLLTAQGVSSSEVARSLRLIAAARIETAKGLVLAISKSQYDEGRIEALRDLGISGKASALPWPPTSQTIYKRLGAGYWGDAVESLGLTRNARGRPRGELLYDTEQYNLAVSSFMQERMRMKLGTSHDDYDRWVQDEERLGRRRPSGASVRMKYGGWAQAKRTILASGDLAISATIQVATPVPNGVAARARRSCIKEIEAGIASVKAAQALDVNRAVRQLVVDTNRHFEFERRVWFRNIIALDRNAGDRMRASGQLSGRDARRLEASKLDPASVLSDRYLDTLLSTSPVETAGWFQPEVQAELEGFSGVGLSKFEVVRSLRNVVEHDSTESRARLGAALAALASHNDAYQMSQSATIRQVLDRLRANESRLLKDVLGCFSEVWACMLLAESAAIELDLE